MSRRLVTAVTLGLLLTVSAALPASADSVSDKKAQAAKIAARKEQLREQGEVLADRINAAQAELETIGKDVGVAEVRLGEQDATIAHLQAQVFQFAVNSYMLGSASSGLGTILAPGGIGNDSAQREGYTSVLLGGSADVADQARALRQDTDKLKLSLVAKQKRQAELTAGLEKTRAQIDKAQAELAELEQQNDAELAQAIKDAEAATQAQLQAGAAERIRKQSEAFRKGQDSGASVGAAPAGVGQVTQAGATSKPAAKPEGNTLTPSVVTAAPRPSASTVPKTPATTAGGGDPAPSAAPTTPPTTAKPKPKPTYPPAPAVSGAAGRAVAAAYSQLGTPYIFATAKPGVGFDCSGLTSWAWAQAGVYIPRTSQEQWAGLPHIPLDQVQPGDLIFYYSDVHHVSIYVGNGTVIHAPYSGSTVSLSGINSHVIGAARPG
jgi:peptidoglycan DL-endopeptidase CwlO